MNTSLRKRLVKKYGEGKVQRLEREFRPPKLELVLHLPRMREKRISRTVIRRRHVNRGASTPPTD